MRRTRCQLVCSENIATQPSSCHTSVIIIMFYVLLPAFPFPNTIHLAANLRRHDCHGAWCDPPPSLICFIIFVLVLVLLAMIATHVPSLYTLTTVHSYHCVDLAAALPAIIVSLPGVHTACGVLEPLVGGLHHA